MGKIFYDLASLRLDWEELFKDFLNRKKIKSS